MIFLMQVARHLAGRRHPFGKTYPTTGDHADGNDKEQTQETPTEGREA